MTKEMQTLALAPVGNPNRTSGPLTLGRCCRLMKSGSLLKSCITGRSGSSEKLILSHLRFVVHIARNYSGYGLPQADLIWEGNIGLMKAVRRFNPEVGVRWSPSPCTGLKPKFTNTCCATGVL